jgi:hypothetical protein
MMDALRYALEPLISQKNTGMLVWMKQQAEQAKAAKQTNLNG